MRKNAVPLRNERITPPRQNGPADASAPLRETALFLLIALALYLALSLLSFNKDDPSWSHSGPGEGVENLGGIVGAYVADIGMQLLGAFAMALPVALGILALSWYRRLAGSAEPVRLASRLFGLVLVASAGGALATYYWPADWWMLPTTGAGGLWGRWLAGRAAGFLNQAGASLFFFALLLTGVSLLSNRSWREIFGWLGEGAGTLGGLGQRGGAVIGRLLQALRDRRGERAAAQRRARQAEPAPRMVQSRPPAPAAPRHALLDEDDWVAEAPAAAPPRPPVLRPAPAPAPKVSPVQESFSELGLPALSELDEPEPPAAAESESALAQRSRLLEEKLANFGVSAEVVAVHPGPVITRYEIEPGPGVKVSQVANLSKDLARSLSAISVRVVETIPGKSVMGIEIPNARRSMVRLRELLASPAFTGMESLVALALGKDIGGNPVVADLARMPHLLVAGTTGSGKSVGVNAMILSMLYKARPEEVRFIMVDPKMLELSVYEGIPHLLAPVVTDMKEAANALRWCVAEMERRYKLMAGVGVRNLAGFNKKVRDAATAGEPLYEAKPQIGVETAPPLEPLPMIVVVIDELADLMMVVGKQVEDLITRLAQKARAAGIHLIMATQRPSVDVITGLIKANVPTRIAFQVSSKIDSRTILDQGGAEQLLGHGDMLYLPPGTGHPLRVHGAFVGDDEIHRVVAFLKQQGTPDYIEAILRSADGDGPESDGEEGGGEADPLYDAAVAIVTESRRASISMVQRKLRVGYNRAARMIEEMERAGIVGPLQSNGSREVYAPPPIPD
ncbi:MAG: DNA translocase FtsK 4TM domain-containing protein [Pseudomonadota bacterium]